MIVLSYESVSIREGAPKKIPLQKGRSSLAQQDLYRRKSPVGGYLKSSHGKTSCCLSMCQQLEILDDTNVLKLSAK